MLYSSALNRLMQIIGTFSWLTVKFVNKPYSWHGGEYNPQNKTITINKNNVSKKQIIELLIHQFHHRLQDRQGYYDHKKNLMYGELLQQRILKRQVKYIKGFHYKYIKQLLKMEYDCQKRSYRFIKEDDIIKDFISPQQYITGANFYILNLKYNLLKGKTKIFKDQDWEKINIIHDRVMTEKQLLRPLTKQQIQAMEEL